MELCLTEKVAALPNILEDKLAKESAGIKVVQEVRDIFSDKTDLMATDSTNTEVVPRNECVNLARADGDRVIQNASPVRILLLKCTHLLNTSLGTISIDHNRISKGHWKRRARMLSSGKREGTVTMKDTIEGENIKWGREEQDLKEGDM